MIHWPTAGIAPEVTARIRSTPEDFFVSEQLGFAPSGEGEHAFLYIEKCKLNTLDVVQRLSDCSTVPTRDIGYSGLKDKQAVTQQWFSVALAGRAEPNWQTLENSGDIRILACSRHRKKLRRGVHRSNYFRLRLTELSAEPTALEPNLERIKSQGVPNYFGPQRFGLRGQTLQRAQQWRRNSAKRSSRKQRGLMLSALRSLLFNQLLADRVTAGDWNQLCLGDRAMLQGSHSHFAVETLDQDLHQRCTSGDLHPGLPLWGEGAVLGERQQRVLASETDTLDFLLAQKLALAWRSARVLPDDFCWQFCDDGALQLAFHLPPGSYATAVLAELVRYSEGHSDSSE